MCQFETLYRSRMDPTQLRLFASYYYLLMSHVAQHFKLYRVRTFGDTVLIVGGIADEKDSASFSQVCHRTLQAAAAVLELFSYQWTHSPSHVPCLRDVSTFDRAMVMPSVRIGAHCGPATLVVEPAEIGPPIFDVLGANVGATVAVCAGAHTNTINATEAMIDAARKAGKFEMFQFDDNARRVTTKVGVMKTQLMRGANVPVPPRVVFAMSIRRATVRVHFGQSENVLHGENSVSHHDGSVNSASKSSAKLRANERI
jgi:class 3 adenylate cyclase